MLLTCSDCRYWQEMAGQRAEARPGTPIRGYCRRSAPVGFLRPWDATTVQDSEAVWPVTTNLDWCGEAAAPKPYDWSEETQGLGSR